MLNSVIRFSLNNRLSIICVALAAMVSGAMVAATLPIDVLPNLTRPRVVLLTECVGMAPEEVERRVTYPLETSVTGATGVTAVRSQSDVGFSKIDIEFDWNMDIFTARQIVQERIASAQNRLPEGIEPYMAPMSSLLGQIMMIGMWSEDGKTDPLALRTHADWVVAQRLRSIEGVSEVITMGGGRKQFHVLVNPHDLHKFEVSLNDVEQAIRDSNLNVTGGYIERSSQELLVRGVGQLTTRNELRDLKQIVVKAMPGRSVLLAHVAQIHERAQIKRGDSSVNGRAAVVLTIQKHPAADTRELTSAITQAVVELRSSLPSDVVIDATLYQQRNFIDYSVRNVAEALRDGSILVVVVLFLFLLNFRTTFITLTAIPLSILITALVFRWFDMSINVMTLGGLAVALGELVDDAIVDVENIFRRLKENSQSDNPRPVLRIIFDASVEVRSAIVVSTVMVIVVFSPLFFLSGIEGRLFTPLGIAYIVAILASTVVSLTVTPVLSKYLLPKARATIRARDGFVLRGLKQIASPVIRFSMNRVGLSVILACVVVGLIGSGLRLSRMGINFLPPFDEGAAQVNLYAQPGVSLNASREISQLADQQFATLLESEDNPDGPIRNFTCKTGRAELDEHIMGVHVSEYVMTLNPNSRMSRTEIVDALDQAAKRVPTAQSEVQQPIAHMISHLLSGVTAQVAIKVFGDDLATLRRKAHEIRAAIADVEGIHDPVVEMQRIVPHLRIDVRRDHLAVYGISTRFVQDFVETAMNGKIVTEVFEGERRFDLLLRLQEQYRRDIDALKRMPLDLPDGTRIPLSEVANIYDSGGPSTINRENARRRIVVRVNTDERDLASTVAEIDRRIQQEVKNWPKGEGYFVVMGGQFEAQRTATQRILWLSLLALAIVLVVLYATYQSFGIALQLLFALPAAFIGGVFALVVTGQDLSVASMVGFISLGGIAIRNGLLLTSTYLDLAPEHGFTKQMILKGSLDRLAPVLMTTLTTGVGLLPLVIGGDLPGKEILFPVATVIVGGLVTSTLCEFLVRPGLFWFCTSATTEKLASLQTTEQLQLK
ncbi:MAG: efflux RND transporter permease subunit [Planctomycetota bacterium]|nr:efflux RND transporter permease subunit [Planctomycetota bacterium]